MQNNMRTQIIVVCIKAPQPQGEDYGANGAPLAWQYALSYCFFIAADIDILIFL